MTVFHMDRIKLWAEKTGREIRRDGHGRFWIPGTIDGPVMRPRFRRMCSKIMLKEGYY